MIDDDAFFDFDGFDADLWTDETRLKAMLASTAPTSHRPDTFVVPARLTPSTALGLALTQMFYSTPAHERV